MSSNKYELEIDGGKYTIVSEVNREKTERIAEYVDREISDVREKNSKLNINHIYILTLMNVSADLFSLKEEFKAFKENMENPMEKYQSLKDELARTEEDKENTLNKLEKIKDDLVSSLNTINDLNKEISSLKEDLEQKRKECQAKEDDLDKLLSRLSKVQEDNIRIEKARQELSKKL